jgi:hypothetical protein
MTLLKEIIENLHVAARKAMELIQRAIDRIAADPAVLSACPHTSALKLAIWSEKAKISREEINKLSPLWGKYFD